MRIAVDAFGSDERPGPDIEGAVLAARAWGDEIILVGPEAEIRRELARFDTQGLNLRVVHAPEIIGMDEHANAVKAKKEASIRVAMRLVKNGEADAFVSAGNTIACLSSALFDLGRIRLPNGQRIDRPALATIFPVAFQKVLLLDVGATADCDASILLQFARMGAIYAERVLGITRPRVGLLANGEEEEKGTMVLRDAFALLKQSDLNFVGNVEPKEVSQGAADVVVTDGFTGNILLKGSETVASFTKRLLKREFWGTLQGKLGLLLALPGLVLSLPGLLLLLPAFKRIVRRLDPFEYGGALLLGVDGVVIIGHGRSNAKAVKNAIARAREAVAAQIVPTIKEGLANWKRKED